MIYSPLRYPGGKNRLAPFIAQICYDNEIKNHYVEPYSGGASVALFLLLENFVQRVTINDKDRSIYAFWYSVLYQTEALCRLIKDTPITLEEWKRQKDIQAIKESANLLDLGFSTFFLNRTNRSGIIKAGIIGGYKQNGIYKMDCRFNKNTLIERICKISEKRSAIDLHNNDALVLIDKIINKNKNYNDTLLYFDPPYYNKSDSLYMNHYKKFHHLAVGERIKNLINVKWIVSYDDTPEIEKLYDGCKNIKYSLKHTAATSREGKEILFFSSNIKLKECMNPLKCTLKKP